MPQQIPDFDHVMASLATAANRASAAVLAPYGLSPLEFGILDWCRRGEANSVSDLAAVFPVDTSGISRQTSRLEKLGLLNKRRSTDDRRRVELTLTETGRALARLMEEPMRAGRARIIEGVSEEEWAAFVDTANKILANLEGMRARPIVWPEEG